MARSRFAKPEFFDDPVLARCSHGARLLFVATWQLADRLGVFEWDVARLRKYAFGYEDVTTAEVSAMLDQLIAGGFIRWADVAGRRYGFVVNLAKHQKFHVAEKSRFEDVAKAATWLSAPCQHPASTLPASLSLETETETETENGSSSGVQKPKRRKTSPEAAPSGVAIIRGLWLKSYEGAYGKPAIWGAKEGGQTANLLKSMTVEELVELVPRFFQWARPEVMKAGHPFGTGPHCFVLKIHELRADTIDPMRRRLAAQIQERERSADTQAVAADLTNRINAIIREEQEQDHAARQLAGTTQRSLEQSNGSHAEQAHQRLEDAGRDVRPEHLGTDDLAVLQSAGAIRRTGTVERAGSIVRGRQVAEHRRDQGHAGWSPRDAELGAASTTVA